MTGAQGRATPARIAAISAVVCNFNGEDYLADCLDALLAAGDQLDEVLVVDNGSTDGSLALLADRYPSVGVLELGRNRGPGAARNAGLAAARNRWVLAIDNDAVVSPDAITRLRAALEADPEAVLAQTRSVCHHDPSTVHYDGARFHYVGLFALRNFFVPLAQAEGDGVLEVDGFVSICGLMDREAVQAVGGYDEDFFILFEDFDLSLRMRIAGQRLLSVEEAIVLHKGGTPGISFREVSYPRRRAFYHSRNRWLLIFKCYRPWTVLVALPGMLVYELVWLLFTLKAGHLMAHLRGKWWFLRALPAAWGKRLRVQRSRRVSDGALLVGGPLTLSPQLVERPLAAAAAGLLDRCLRAWWTVAGRLVR